MSLASKYVKTVTRNAAKDVTAYALTFDVLSIAIARHIGHLAACSAVNSTVLSSQLDTNRLSFSALDDLAFSPPPPPPRELPPAPPLLGLGVANRRDTDDDDDRFLSFAFALPSFPPLDRARVVRSVVPISSRGSSRLASRCRARRRSRI
jgi:hypothetical protein